MTNLLEETTRTLLALGKDPKAGVNWVGSNCGRFRSTWDDFVLLAGDFDYDQGFGSQHVPKDLVIVGSGWWLERHEYDGSEGWEFKSGPQPLAASRPIRTLGDVGQMWVGLGEAHGEGD